MHIKISTTLELIHCFYASVMCATWQVEALGKTSHLPTLDSLSSLKGTTDDPKLKAHCVGPKSSGAETHP